MPSTKSSFVEKVLGRIDVLNPENLQSFVERLARDRSFLETLFNTIEDGVLVADQEGKVTYNGGLHHGMLLAVPQCRAGRAVVTRLALAVERELDGVDGLRVHRRVRHEPA